MRSGALGFSIATILLFFLDEQIQAAPPLKSSVMMTAPPRIALPRPSAVGEIGLRRRHRDRDGYEVQPWLDSTDTPTSLPSSQKGVFLLARDLVLGDQQMSLETPLLIVVADSLKINGNTVIDLSSRQPFQRGGSVMLLARSINCEGAGRLTILSAGGKWSASGGSLIVAGAGTTLPPCITHTAPGGPGGVVRVRDHRGPGDVKIRKVKMAPGRSGTVSPYPDIEAALRANPAATKAASAWILHRLAHLRFGIYAAASGRDDRKVLDLFKEYESIGPSVTLVAEESKPQYLDIVKDLNEYRTTALAPLFVEDLTINTAGTSRIVTVFTEGATLRSSLAPTNALAVRALAAGRPVLGLLDYRNDKPDELAIEIEWELTVDPWVAAAATRGGTKPEGVFGGWSLEAKPMEEFGVRSATAKLLPGGRRLRLRLVADAASANLVFWRLFNTGGLPWTVDWTYREQRTNRVITGTWAGPPLSVAYQRTPQVQVEEGKIKNNEASNVTIAYVRSGEASFTALNPALSIQPGESAMPEGVTGNFTVPPEAVEVAFDPERFAANFHVTNGQEIIDKVVIRNMLPATDNQRGAFDRAEITVTSTTQGGADSTAATAGPFILSATGTRGAEVTLPMLRLGRGAREVTVTGRAYYVGGSERTIGPRTFDTLSIAITSEMFRE